MLVRAVVGAAPVGVLARILSASLERELARRKHNRPPGDTAVSIPLTSVSTALRTAVDAKGGAAAVERDQHRVARYGRPFAVACLAKEAMGRSSPVILAGEVALRDAVAIGPVLIVEPHLGPGLLVAALLHLRGMRVAQFTVRPASEDGLLFAAARSLRPGVARAEFRQLRIGDPFVLRQARAAWRDGFVVVWQPDADTLLGHGDRRLCGVPVQEPRWYDRLAGELAVRVFLAGSRLGVGYCSVIFHEVDATSNALYAACDDFVRANVEQWSPLLEHGLLTQLIAAGDP